MIRDNNIMIFICESSKKQTKRRNNMSSSNKTSLGLNAWSPSDKPVRQDFVDDNIKIDEQITKLNRDLAGNTYASFTAYPAVWLPPLTRGFSHQTVAIPPAGNFNYAPPTRTESNGAAWWNVLTFGISSRCTQIACYSYNYIAGGGMIYMRYQHDDVVSAWMQVL